MSTVMPVGSAPEPRAVARLDPVAAVELEGWAWLRQRALDGLGLLAVGLVVPLAILAIGLVIVLVVRLAMALVAQF